FLPNLTFKAQAILDEDLTSAETGTNTYSGRIELKYNLFNGNKDSNVKQREILFLQESQKTLDTITRDVVDRLTVAYDNYQVSKEQIFELKQYVADNLEILAIYNDQFEGGTRTFLDVLNAEGDIYNSKTSLVDAEYVQLDAYYEMFSILSTLNTTVLASQDQVCKQMQIITKKKVKEDPSMDELSDLLEDEPVSTPEAPVEEMKEEPKEIPAEESVVEPVEKMEEKVEIETQAEVMEEKKAEVMTPAVEETAVEAPEEVMEVVSKTQAVEVTTTAIGSSMTLNEAMLKEFSNELQKDILAYDTDSMTLKLSDSFLKLSDSGVVMSADYKELIRDVFPRLVRVTKSYENEIAEVKVEGHSSSSYAGVEDVQRKFVLNQVISLQRAKTVLGYGANLEVSTITDNSDFLSNTYKAYGLSSANIVKNSDGTENRLLSKRVEFVIIPK
ncbi:MAG: TolC family protein, partial [Campylobacteraceae bacterium]|nr:TolC family protein [Campylobacteraceae bacterium]